MSGKIIKGRITKLFVIAIAMLAAVFALLACDKEDGASVKLELDTSSAVTTFGVGEAFTTDGLIVVAVVGGERFIASHAEYDVVAPDMSKAGDKKVTIRFMGASASYTITVVNVEITELTVDATNAKTEFVQGDEFTSVGLVVTPTLSFGESKPVKLSECQFSGYDAETLGEQIITVTYRGASATYTIKVVPLAPKTLTFGLDGVRTVYAVGGSFDRTGLTATVVMNNGDTHAITEFYVEATSFTEPGNNAVTVTASYNGQPVSGQFNVCVLPKATTEYADNQTLNFTNTTGGGEVLTLYITKIEGGGANSVTAHTYGWTILRKSDGVTAMDEFEYTYNPANWASNFVKCVGSATIVDGGALQITVDDAVFTVGDSLWHYVVIGWDEVVSISVDDTDGVKTTYFVGDPFDPSGIVVKLHRISGAEENLENAAIAATFSGFNSNTPGEKTITVTYDGKSATYTVNVIAVAVASLEIDYTKAKTQYLIGDEFDPTGLVITAVMNNGTRQNVYIDDCTFGDYDLSEAGEYNVKVEYNGVSETYPITVTALSGVLTGISVDDTHVKKDYIAGDVFDPTGLVVTAHYEDIGDETIDVSACSFSGYNMNEAGTYTVTVTYGGKDATYQITVGEARLVRIEVDYSNAKREYLVNGEFSSSGLVVTAYYSNGTTKTIEDGEYNVSDPDMTEIGVKTITVEFEQQTAEYKIYAIPDVNWDTNKLDFGDDQNGNGATLELYVTERENENGYWGQEQYTKGWLLVRNADGSFEMYEFEYQLKIEDNQSVSYLYPSGAPDGVNAYLEGDPLVVEVGGNKFVARDVNRWHYVVLGWQ